VAAATTTTTTTTPRQRPKLAVFKFASCDGCQLSLLDLEESLLALADAVDIAYFREATRLADEGPFDLTLIDGSITTAHDAARIRDIRARSRRLVALGACATTGGIQALRNFRDVGELTRVVYARPDYIDTLATSTAVAEHVTVDFELRGCPPDRHQLLEVVSAFLNARAPAIAAHSVCLECKLRGNVCVMVTGTPCLGPVTHAGCGALCPTYHRGCYGCFGPAEAPNTAALAGAFAQAGKTREDLLRVFRTFNANAPAFRDESVKHEGGRAP
jgi:coenzyme F420-reducing hydrogenase gamma subunit